MLEQSILAWLAIGLVIGLASRLLRGQRDPGGLIVGVLIGIAGALLAGYVAQAAGVVVWRGQLAIAAAGAVLLLLVYRITLARRSR